MKRSAFKQKGYTPRPSRQVNEPNPGVTSACSVHQLHKGVFNKVEIASTLPILKFVYVRSKPLLEACREIPCQHCGIDDGSVCGAHSNQQRHGKGRSIKASDVFCASLCFKCHANLDQGSEMTKSARESMWDLAHRATVKELLKRGLWPADVAVPDIRRMN